MEPGLSFDVVRPDLVFQIRDARLSEVGQGRYGVWFEGDRRVDCFVEEDVAVRALSGTDDPVLLGPCSGYFTDLPLLNNWWFKAELLFAIPRLCGETPAAAMRCLEAWLEFAKAREEGRWTPPDYRDGGDLMLCQGKTSFWPEKARWSGVTKHYYLWADGMPGSATLPAARGDEIVERQPLEPCLVGQVQMRRVYPSHAYEPRWLWVFRDTWFTTGDRPDPQDLPGRFHAYFDNSMAAVERQRQRDEEEAVIRQAEAMASKRQRDAKLAWARTVVTDAAGGPRRDPIPREVRRAVFERDGGACVECDARFDIQYDHIIPVALGGATSIENLQILCGDCNRRKGVSL